MQPFVRAVPVLLLLTAAALAEDARLTIPKKSPFEDTRKPAAAVAAASETIEFAGVSALGKRTDLIFYDKTAKKNHWIAEGETKEGISVLKYDARREQVVVKINGAEKILQLRKGSGPVNAPAGVPPMPVGFNTPAPLPAGVQKIQPPPPTGPTGVGVDAPAVAAPPPAAKPEGPATPELQQKQETEARMLVSDLLEIGMAQRKAYEEAQRKAASTDGAQPPEVQAPPPTNTTPADKPNGT